MNCETFRERIHLYLDNQLTTLEAGELRSHIGECEECQKELVIWQKIMGAIRNGPVIDPPTDFTKDLKLSLPKHAYETSVYTSTFWIGPFLLIAILFALCWIFRSDIFEATLSFSFWKTLLWVSVGCIATVASIQIAGMLGIMIQQKTPDDLEGLKPRLVKVMTRSHTKSRRGR